MLSYHKVLLSFYIYMYTSMARLAPMLLFSCTLYSIDNHMAPHIPSPSPLIVDDLYCEPTLNLTLLDALNIFPIGCLLFSPIIVLLFHHWETLRFVSFSTNLSLPTKRSKQAIFPFSSLLILNLQIILLNEDKESWYSLLIITRDINFSFSFETTRHTIKKINVLLFTLQTIHVFYLATTPSTIILSFLVFQNSCHYFIKHTPCWLPSLLIILSHDVHQNPGPTTNSYFTFMSWNLNSMSKDDFHRLKLLEAQNSIFNNDLISLCETSLNDTVLLPDGYLPDYTFIFSNKPDDTRHGGVGLYYKTSLPHKVRNDLAFDESIVVELNFGRKKILFTILDRSPAANHSSTEFANFLSNFTNLHSSIKKENPYVCFFTGDFNKKSQLWWPDGDTSPEGTEIENLLTQLGLTQVITEPTNFEPNKNPSCALILLLLINQISSLIVEHVHLLTRSAITR